MTEIELSPTSSLNPKMVSINATVIRADGTVEPLGVVSYYNRNPLMMLWWEIKQLIKGI